MHKYDIIRLYSIDLIEHNLVKISALQDAEMLKTDQLHDLQSSRFMWLIDYVITTTLCSEPTGV
jgi:hypothetical protein